MRLYPAVWGIARQSTNIFIFQSLMQRDPRFFPNPDAFDPERWRENPICSGRIPRFAYLSFGGGPKVCVSAAFATFEATFLLAMMPQQFHLDHVPGHPIRPLPTVTLRSKHGIPVTVQRRPTST